MPALWFPVDPRPLVGVWSNCTLGGDKVCLALAPLLAALGIRSPALFNSGASALACLGSVPGLNTAPQPDEIARIVQETGCVFSAVPKNLYLQDSQPTDDSVAPAKVVGEKLAQGAQALVVQLVFGPGWPIETAQGAEAAAKAFHAHASKTGLKLAVVTEETREPIGAGFGSWLEMKEVAQFLDCRGSAEFERIVLSLAAEALLLAGKCADKEAGQVQAATALASGEPRRRLDQALSSQGANLREFRRQLESESLAAVTVDCGTTEEGVVLACKPSVIQQIMLDLRADGAASGLDQLAKIGEPFGPGCTMGRIHASTKERANRAADQLHAAFEHSRTCC